MMRRIFVGCAVAAGLAAVSSAKVWAVPGDPDGKGPGKAPDDLAELTADWWQWVYSIPAKDVTVKTGPHTSATTNTNPLLDSTGDFAQGMSHPKGPGDKYYFLGGTFGGDAVRTVEIPHGKSLFFPVVNTESDNAVDPVTHFTASELSAIAKANVDATATKTCTFDGVDVPLFRTQSPPFAYTLPNHDSVYQYFGLTGPQFQGTVYPAVSDGWWAVVPAPAPGAHVLHFTASNPSPFSLDVTYDLIVK